MSVLLGYDVINYDNILFAVRPLYFQAENASSRDEVNLKFISHCVSLFCVVDGHHSKYLRIHWC